MLLLNQIEDGGRLVGVGAGDGCTTVVRLDESLIDNTKLNRNNASDMFERLVRSLIMKFYYWISLIEKQEEKEFLTIGIKLSRSKRNKGLFLRRQRNLRR